MNSLSLSNTILSSILYLIITILLKIYTKSSTINTSLYGFKYTYFVSIFTITSMLLYIIPIRGFFNIDSLVIKSRVIDNHTCLSKIEIYSFS